MQAFPRRAWERENYCRGNPLWLPLCFENCLIPFFDYNINPMRGNEKIIVGAIPCGCPYVLKIALFLFFDYNINPIYKSAK